MTIVLKSRFKGVSKDFLGGGVQISLETQKVPEKGVLEGLMGKDFSVTIKEWRERRSLDANAYYWTLLSQLAEVLKMSRPSLHNLLLRSFGEDEDIDGQTVFLILPDSQEAEKKAQESETYHLRPTSQTKEGKDGKTYRTWVLLKGSHDMDTKAFSRLLDGLIEECKAQGIDTMTPDQIERMMRAYEVNHAGGKR